MNRSALFLVLPLLAGCNVHSKNPAGSDGNVSIQADQNGSISFNLPIAQGKVKVPTSFMHEGNIDIDGVKLMPGSSVTGFNVDAHDHGATVNMTFTAPATPDEVRNYFVGEFKKQGVDAAISDGAVSGKSKDGSPFLIQVAQAGGGSTGKIEIQSKD
ncbi:MAG: hypothetical protein ACTHKE_06255 [Sphingomicrobium sp.]